MHFKVKLVKLLKLLNEKKIKTLYWSFINLIKIVTDINEKCNRYQ